MEFVHTSLGDWPDIDFGALAERRAFHCRLSGDAFAASGNATANLEALLSGEALCVTTGQQPGLFLGPLYTVYKAIAAVVAAERMEQALGRRVVPVFWVAGDDHDFAEGNHFQLPGRDGTPERVVLRERPEDAPSRPLYKEAIGIDIADVESKAEELLTPTEFRDGVLLEFTRAYHAESDLAESFATLLADLLGDFGVSVFVATRASAKPPQMGLLLQALELAGDIDRALAARAAEMSQAGRKVPVKVGDGATLVMIEAAQGRDRLVIDGTGFRTRRSGETFTLDELRTVATDTPRRLSANVLLRPVVEASLFPTIAYLGGPGELAYFEQCDPIYDALGVTPQAKLPRWSAVVIEPRIRKVMDRFSLTLADLAAPAGELETRLAREDLPDDIRASLSQIRETLQSCYGAVGTAATGIDPTLKKPVEAARNQSLAAARGIEKKVISHLKQKNETMLRQIGRARTELFPGGSGQERVFNPLPFLVRHGGDFLSRALDACRDQYAIQPIRSDR